MILVALEECPNILRQTPHGACSKSPRVLHTLQPRPLCLWQKVKFQRPTERKLALRCLLYGKSMDMIGGIPTYPSEKDESQLG